MEQFHVICLKVTVELPAEQRLEFASQKAALPSATRHYTSSSAVGLGELNQKWVRYFMASSLALGVIFMPYNV